MIARPKMTESELQYAILDLAKRLGLLAMHVRDSRRNIGIGFPDLVLAGRGGVIFVELKNDKHQPTDMQMHWLGTLAEGGADAMLWRPDQWRDGTVLTTLQRLARPRPLPTITELTEETAMTDPMPMPTPKVPRPDLPKPAGAL